MDKETFGILRFDKIIFRTEDGTSSRVLRNSDTFLPDICEAIEIILSTPGRPRFPNSKPSESFFVSRYLRKEDKVLDDEIDNDKQMGSKQ